MVSYFHRKNRCVSIIIKDHVIRYIEFIHPKTIKKFGERRLPAGIIREGNIIERETLVMILEDCVENWEIKGAQLLFCVPDSFYIIRKTLVPINIPDDEVKGELYFELGEKLHLPFDDPLLEICVGNVIEEEKEVIVVASSERMVDEYRSLFEEVKLKPIIADVSSLSVYRLFYSLDLASKDDHFLIVQMNLDGVNLTVFYQDKPLFTRHMRLSSDGELWDSSTDSDGLITWTIVGDKEKVESQIRDVALEIERTMNFYHFSVHQGKMQVTKVIITGDDPNLDDLIKACKDILNIPIMKIPESIFKTQNKWIPQRFYETIGLVMHGRI